MKKITVLALAFIAIATSMVVGQTTKTKSKHALKNNIEQLNQKERVTKEAEEKYILDTISRYAFGGGNSTITFKYDKKGNCIKQTYPNAFTFEYTYDENNVLTTVKRTTEYPASSGNENSTKKEDYIYEDNKLTQIDYYLLTGADFVLIGRDKFVTDTVRTYSILENVETLALAEIKTPKTNNKEIATYYEVKNDVFSLQDSIVYIYEDDKLVREEEYGFDEEEIAKAQTDIALLITKDYTYDAVGNMTNIVTMTVKDSSDIEYEVTYNLDISKQEILIPIYDMLEAFGLGELVYINMPTEVDETWLGFLPASSLTFKYNKRDPAGMSGVISSFDLGIYPNPATDQIVVSNQGNSVVNFELYDIQGKKLMTEKFVGTKTFNISNLTQGTYIYKAIEGDKVSNGKIIKR